MGRRDSEYRLSRVDREGIYMISLPNDMQESIILDDCKILPHIEGKVIEKEKLEEESWVRLVLLLMP